MEIPISESTRPSYTSATTIWSFQDRFEDTNIIDLDTRFIGEFVLEKLMENSKDRFYSNYLDTRKISNYESLETILFSLERSKIFAETCLKFGSLEIIENSKVLETSEDEYTKTQLASIYGTRLTNTLANYLTKVILITQGIPINGLSEEDSEYLTKIFEPFSSNESLKKLLHTYEKLEDIINTVYFITVVIVSLWTKSGNHESYAYLTGFRQALYCEDENEVSIRYESDLFSSVRQGAGIAVPGISGPALYINDIDKKYNKTHKNGNKLNFIITAEIAELCYGMIEDMHNLFNKILPVQSAKIQNASEAKTLNNSNLSAYNFTCVKNEIAYKFNKFQEAKKALQEIEKEGIQERESVNFSSVFNKYAEDKYKIWLEAYKKESKLIAQATQFA